VARSPVGFIDQYLGEVYKEAALRVYHFNRDKIDLEFKPAEPYVTSGQLEYEAVHLLKKLLIRDGEKYIQFRNEKSVEPHPLFRVVEGEIEEWERR
jgi:hypothetical protein